jgi:NADP-dependent 3-hydroxy acid dehydrogenase YdfG
MSTVSTPTPFTAAITGASSGIGAAVAREFAQAGARLFLTARDGRRLEAVAQDCVRRGGEADAVPCDLLDHRAVADFAASVLRSAPGLDALVHAAGAYSFRSVDALGLDEFRRVVRVNLTAPFQLTQGLLSGLRAARGWVVFVNSSAVERAQANTSAYTASKHALRGFADVLRAEVNRDGVRVLSVYPGRTATPMQERVAEAEGSDYHPAALLPPDAVARAIHDALRLPASAEVTELRLRPARP